jgi:hypothetical protein
MIKFTGSLYNFLQHFTNHYFRLDILDFWPLYTNPLLLESDSESESYVTTYGQSACLSWNKAPIWGLRLDSYYCQAVAGGAPSLTRGRLCRLQLLLASPAQSFSGSSPADLVTIFYCLSFETSLFVASYDSQGYGGGIPPRLHKGESLSSRPVFLVI